MPLEAVMICVDNSDYARNGDYTPTRFDSQTDACNLVCGAKTQQHVENAVGILTTAGDRIEVMITPSTDLGKILAELPKIKLGGNADLTRGIQTAQLSLKHRQNKNQKQRIIAFVSSPVTAGDKELETLGKNLKKNNVSLDLISIGEVEENTAKLEKLLNAVNSNDSSHLLEVPVGPKLLSDVLLTSLIINPDGVPGGGGEGGAAGGDGFEFGIDPNSDPELALALRISMEEERARQNQNNPDAAAAPADGAAAAPAEGAAGDAAAAPAAPAAAAPPSAAPAMPMDMMEGMDDMDEELRQALLLSLQEADPVPEAAPAAAAAPAVPDVVMTDAPKAAEAPAAAAAEPAPAAAAAAAPAAAAAEGDDATVDSKWFQDPSFVQELLGSLPGVDINDPRIQQALQEVGGEGEEGAPAADAAASGSAEKKPDPK